MHACLLNRFSGRGSHQVGPCAPSAVRRCTHTHTPWRRGHGIGSTAPSSPLLLSFLPPFLFFRSVTCLFSLPFCLIVPACMCAQLISSFSLSAIFLVDFCCRFAGGTLLSRRASQRRQSCAKKNTQIYSSIHTIFSYPTYDKDSDTKKQFQCMLFNTLLYKKE